ncbi:mitochondrial fission 1 protein-like [Gigantopelta aegis]|uniref:mitochondrial fission 1 protein-like n=1 Tax=Gigantopelta aegis TaxID=1735272 RepID=UPI001B887584|nr:mitochondrial fission 1 protein-like [Gigantopelta aegis]
MEAIVEDNVDAVDLKKFELQYHDQARKGPVSEKAQFDYAWCLVRSRYQQDMKRGVALLEDLFARAVDETSKRDYLFYMSVGYTRIKEYASALNYVKAVLKIEPENRQAKELETYIKKKMQKEGLMGMAIVGGAAVALGGLIGLGIAAAKSAK